MTKPRSDYLGASFLLVGLTLLFFWKILLTNLILVGLDTFLYFYPYKAYTTEALLQGRLPLWNPHLFMGTPLLANSQVGVFYPLNWLFLWLEPPKQVAWSIGLHIALAGLGMLTYARQSLRLGWLAALVTAMMFAFGGYLGAQVEHLNQLNAAAWLPLLFLLYDHSLLRERRWLWRLCLALTIALTLLAGHTQTVFISLFGLGLYGLWRAGEQMGAWRMANKASYLLFAIRYSLFAIRTLLPLALASLYAAALAAIQLLPTAELSSLSIRSGGLTFREAVAFSLRPTLLHLALLPPVGLDLAQAMGEAFGEWVAYLGVSGLLLALLGGWLSYWNPEIRRYVFVAGSGLVLSLGMFNGPLYLALYYLAPGFNLFRVPARWLLLYAFGMAILAGFGLEALQSPLQTGQRLAATWLWLRARWWRLALVIALPLLFLLGLILWKTPPVTLVVWFSLTMAALGLLVYAMRIQPTSSISKLAFVFLLLIELFFASHSLTYNQPTAPQAYTSWRNAPAFLLAADPPHQPTPPGRFLSLSGITYDPGDLADLRQIFGPSLSEKALYNLIVATKEKEVLFYNLPLVYGLHSVDGYDGGLLPLKQFITLQKLFLPPDDLSMDGRLREKLRFVPPGRLLSLLNTRWIITDKQFDVWIDDIFYDLQFPARLAPGQSVTATGVPNETLPGSKNVEIRDIPIFPATAIGLVSHLEGATDLPDATPVADVILTFAGGLSQTITLKTGLDTAEGHYGNGVAHPQAKIGVAWPYESAGVDYIAVHMLTQLPKTNPVASLRSLQAPIPDDQIIGITVTATLPAGQFILRGLSLINQPTTTSRSVLLTTEGHYRQVHSGDVKIYENLAVLPRAFIVHQAEVVQTDEQAIARLQDPNFNPAETLVRLPQVPPLEAEPAGLRVAGQPSPHDQANITSYQPERVEIMVRLNSPGWLVLTDTFYPGWQAIIDGQPVEIMPVNLMFRAVAVPEGQHQVVFEFKPRSLQIGAWVSGLALSAVVIGLIITGEVKQGVFTNLWHPSKDENW
jgi:hypothetical protein